MLRDVGKEKKSQIDALDRFDQQFQNIRKEKKNKQKFPRVVYQKKNPRTYHYILSLIAQCGAYPFNFFFEISKK